MNTRRGLSTVELAVVSALWGPLLLLGLSAGAGMLNRMEALEAARQAAHRYARGAAPSDAGIRAALERTGGGTLILSTICYIGRSKCREQRMTARSCANAGYFVFTHRLVLGDSRRCPSRYGAPDLALTDPRTGAILPRDAASHPGARAAGFDLLPGPPDGMPGQAAYVVEACVPARDPGAFGRVRRSYAQAIF